MPCVCYLVKFYCFESIDEAAKVNKLMQSAESHSQFAEELGLKPKSV